MNYQQNFALQRARLTALVGIVTFYGFAGCGDAGDALPEATKTSVKRDASVKRDTALATGGAGGGAIAVGTGGSGGTTDVTLGTGGATTSLPDASVPRDTAPDLPADAARGVFDVGVGVEAPTSLDSNLDTRDATTAGFDASSADAPVELGLRDATVDTRDVAPDLIPADGREVGDAPTSDLPSDLPSDPPSPDTTDAPSSDTADAPNGPACTNPGWAKKLAYGLTGGLAGDKEGTPFMVNGFYNTLEFGGTVGTIANAGDSDALVVRLDPATGGAVWAKAFGDSRTQGATRVAIDKSGRVGFIGKFEGSMTVGGSSVANDAPWPASFVGALQATDGAGLWAISANLRSDSGAEAGLLAAIAANPNWDDFVVCGSTNVAATEVVAGAVAGGGYDIVVAKIKGSDGSILWARQIGGTGDQLCTAAAVDDSGDVIVAGTFNGQLDFGSGAFSPAPAANSTLPWIAKMSGSSGSMVAAISAVPGLAGRTQGYVSGLDTDPAGNIAIVGSFTRSLVFGSAPTVSITSAGSSDAYVVKLSPTLVPAWAKSWGDANNSQFATAVAFDSLGNMTVVGYFYGTINIGAGGAILTAVSDATSSGDDILFSRLNGASGDSQCALRFGGTSSEEAYNILVSRFATGAARDVTFASGQFLRDTVLDFGSVALDATGYLDANLAWLARF